MPTDLLQVYHQPAEEVVAALDTNASNGLSAAAASARLEQYGRNELASAPPVPAWRKFLEQFQDVLVVLLLIATAISAGLWLYERDSALPYEALAIFTILMLNAIMGYVQTTRAEEAINSLRAMTPSEATVLRDGQRQKIHSAELVPGDIMLVEEGDAIAADARLLESAALKTMEAALTGESLPVAKETAPVDADAVLGDRTNMIFSGTAAAHGRGKAIIVATGMQTEIGRIAGMLENAPEEITPLQKQLDRVGKLLGIIVIAIAIVMVATIVLVEGVTGASALIQVLIFGVALAVAAVPEGLPAVVTVALSIGVQRMARRKAIVRHLAAVETLGSATVVASDKTGTLTRNEMTVRKVATAGGMATFSGTGYAPEGEVTGVEGSAREELGRALLVAIRANNAMLQQRDGRWIVQGDPTEGALLTAARKAGLDPGAQPNRAAEIPFSSERKLMSAIYRESMGGRERDWLFVKGAPDVLLNNCTREYTAPDERPLNDERRAQIQKAVEELAGDALRTLGVAYRALPDGAAGDASESLEQDLVFAGLIGMIDPPREEAHDSVARAKGAGIRPIMITGDHPATAAVIARELVISEDGKVVTGRELEGMPDEELRRVAASASVFARVNPEHKLRIVEALQRNGDVVGMTGDGVNDAPALKRADIGIAMGISGTDVSKEVADMVLADDNFATIVAAVEEGRAIFLNIRKFLVFLLSSNIGEVLTMFFGVLLMDQIGLPMGDDHLALPLAATQILWINLATDGGPALALSLDPASANVMDRKPRPRGEGVITSKMWFRIVSLGAVMAVGTLLVLDSGMPGGFIEGTGDLPYAQTLAFTTLVLFQMFNIFNSRSSTQSGFVGLFTNSWLWIAIATSVLLQVAAVYVPLLQQAFGTVPLTFADWGLCTAVASSVLIVSELSKAFFKFAGSSGNRAA